MAGVTGTSGGSGLDIRSIVEQLMKVERQPLLKMQRKEVDYQAKISAYATLLTSVSGLKSAITSLKNSTVGMTATSSDASYFTATASTSATAGSTTLQIGRLASAQSIYSVRFGSQTAAVADLSSVTSQKIKIQVGSGTEKEITIDSSKNTLNGVKDAINAAGAGLTASVVKETDKFVIDANNNTIKFNYNSITYTATLAASTYTGAELATEITSKMNAQAGAGTFTADYNSTSATKFTIKNNGPASADFLWGDTVTTAQQILGFSPISSTSVSSGATVTGQGTVDGTYKLTLTSTSTGTNNRITIKVDEDNLGYSEAGSEIDKLGLSVLAFNPTYNSTTGATTGGTKNLEQSTAGLDAKMKANGIELFRSSNTITDVVTGVTINLVKADANYDTTPTNLTLTVAVDSSSLSAKLTSMVSGYNTAMNAINSLKGNKVQRGVLNGDSTLLTLSDTLQRITTNVYGTSTTVNKLATIGVTHDKKGVLSFDSSKLSSLYSSNASDVTTMVNSFASSLDSTLSTYVNTAIPTRQDGYKQSLKSVQLSEENLNRNLSLKEKALLNKFIKLDDLLNRLQGTSNYLQQQMSKLGKIFGGK
ncbi:MAG: flagellar filament capping protein FliD [Candidatus Tectomicrobia bacterium]|uniref:Flagellar hook-associated protein 2 n=1 Tax=Tectimicrobiota bacterium TaxID=2528274 RepID=A0A932CPE1_UNCTE|nr:flagellar filament capping protein FliD [Candidatus Tectomicrobia bacterium]